LTIGRAKIGCITILALVTLRLVVGWHFFSEGRKKLTYDPRTGSYEVSFSAENFLAGAKGPLADTMLGFAPGTHNWRRFLAQPRQDEPLSPEEEVRRAEWSYDYAQRRSAAATEKKPIPIEMPEFAPYAEWGRKVGMDWKALADYFVESQSLTEAQRAEVTAKLDLRRQQLADYLAGESAAIADYRHELWRVEQMEQAPIAGEVPFQNERIAQKTAELRATPRKWVAAVESFGEHFRQDLREIIPAEARSDGAVEESLNPPQADPGEARLARLNMTVTYVVIGVGVCLLLGFFTRLASLVGIGFLCSVIASQPPWVAGSNTDVFLYQLVECAALAVLIVTAAGRWFGLDFFSYAIWNQITGRHSDDD
jgi:uncharacterized membrane protein YphA (DoxX/SURF4 family)